MEIMVYSVKEMKEDKTKEKYLNRAKLSQLKLISNMAKYIGK